MIDALVARAPALAGLHGTTVIVACSGGADSTALLALAVAAGATVHATYVDHGLRTDSVDDFAALSVAAAKLGVERVTCRKVDVTAGSNLEARARDARYAALDAARLDVGAEFVLVGHTLDDQAETVLLALLRGSASAGLGGMPEQRGAILRPLLALRRSETRGLCEDLELPYALDPMNRDARFRRVWVRETLLPMLSEESQRDLAPVLARQAAVLRAESDYLDALAGDALAAAGSPPAARALAALHPVLQKRAVRLLLRSPPIALAQVDAVLEVISGARLGAEVSGGRAVRRRSGTIVVTGATASPTTASPTLRDREPSSTVNGSDATPTRWSESSAHD